MLHLIVVGMGPGDPGDLTDRARATLLAADRAFLRTARHGVARWLLDQRAAQPLDELFDAAPDYDALNETIAAALLQGEGTVAYGVPGSGIGEAAWQALRRGAERLGAQLSCIAGLPMAAPLLEEAAPRGEMGSLRLVPALQAERFDPGSPIAISEIDSRVRAQELKLRLQEFYPDEHPLLFLAHRGGVTQIPLYELDRQASYGNRAACYVPPCPLEGLERFGYDQLAAVMARLRGAEGCPWDKEQTHESLTQYLIEEAYEVLDAVDSGAPDRLADELGDVLLQVAFHAQIAREHGEFDHRDIATNICRKMMERHPHIFGSVRADTADEVVQNWEAIKRREKGLTTVAQSLRDIPRHYPALMRGAKVQKKAALAGWGSRTLPEAREALAQALARLDACGEADRPVALGELLFAAANLCCLAGEQPELLADRAASRFIERFAAMERLAARSGVPLTPENSHKLAIYWQQAGELDA